VVIGRIGGGIIQYAINEIVRVAIEATGGIAIGRTGGAGILGLIGRTEITHVVDIMDLPGIVDILRITRTIGLIPQQDTMQHLPPARSLQVSPRD
jgi:hypothetical protein